MKQLHYFFAVLVLAALVGLPAWYAVAGKGAEAVPGQGLASKETLRSNSGRVYVGGGPRLGK